jgi:hypothetical protein
MGVVAKLKLNEKKYMDFMVGTSELAMRIPSTREIIKMESKNTTLDGGVDIAGYIGDICKLIIPQNDINSICKVPSEIDIAIGERNITLKGITAEKSLQIIAESAKIEKDPKDPSNVILRPNTEGMIDSILALSEEKIDIDDLKYKEVMQIPDLFQEKIEVSTLMDVYNFFQENFQA